MCQQLNGLYAKYQKNEAAKKKKSDSWSDDEDSTPKKDDLWSDDDQPVRKPRKAETAEPEVQVRSTRRRANKPQEEEEKPAPKSANDDLLGLGLWDETPAAPVSEAPAKKSRKPNDDDWGFDDEPV